MQVLNGACGLCLCLSLCVGVKVCDSACLNAIWPTQKEETNKQMNK